MISDPLLYPIADALQIPLHTTVGGGFVGEGKLKLKLGPWQAEVTSKVRSDQVTREAASAFVHVHSQLWGYLIVDQMGHRVRLALFDAATAKVKFGEIESVKTGTIFGTLKAIKPAIVGAFEYHKDRGWQPYDVVNLVE